MTLSITVKNTFLTIDEAVSARVRSSSVPRAFKPNPDWSCGNAPQNDVSTNASDRDTTDNCQASYSDSECGEEFADCRHDHLEMPTAYDKSRVTLSLDNMVSTEAKVRCKLRTKAQPFKPVRAPPAEVEAVIANAVKVLSGCMDIVNVQVNDGGMSGTTIVVGESASTDPDVSWTFALVKDALVKSAEQSERTYILGYDAQPFNNLDPLSFSASIACVPTSHLNTACWDTYQQGFCPRCSTCRWDHPSEYDTMRLIVMIKKQTASTWLD